MWIFIRYFLTIRPIYVWVKASRLFFIVDYKGISEDIY